MRATLGLLVFVLLILQYQFWIGEGGVVDVVSIQGKLAAKKARISQKAERNLALKAEVVDLRNGHDAIEERSRHDLGLIKPGETFFQVVDQHR